MMAGPAPKICLCKRPTRPGGPDRTSLTNQEPRLLDRPTVNECTCAQAVQRLKPKIRIFCSFLISAYSELSSVNRHSRSGCATEAQTLPYPLSSHGELSKRYCYKPDILQNYHTHTNYKRCNSATPLLLLLLYQLTTVVSS